MKWVHDTAEALWGGLTGQQTITLQILAWFIMIASAVSAVLFILCWWCDL